MSLHGKTSDRAFLSKSAFLLGRSCPTKLYYYLKDYPTSTAQDPYLELLAEGGFMVGKMAQLHYPEGVLISTEDGLEQACARTKELLQRDEVTIFEATLISGQKIVSIDILKKKGNNFELIEVKSASFDRDEDEESRRKYGRGCLWNAKGSAIRSEWREIVDDIAFQVLVFEELFPDTALDIRLMLPDITKRVAIDAFAAQFQLTRSTDSGKERVAVHFTGDAARVRKESFLVTLSVDEEVRSVLPEVRASAHELLESISSGITRVTPILGKKCEKCEFRVDKESQRNGFRECWGELADVEPHVFDLYFGGALKRDKRFLLDELIQQGSVSLYDIPEDALSGVRGERQRIQIEYTRKNKEWISDELKQFLRTIRYPLHFVDFETSRLAVPMHRHMRPFEQVAFQWSCHTLQSPDATPQHSDWINTEPEFPNFHFARSLMQQIGDEGTVLVWATHEQTTLKEIHEQMSRFGIEDRALASWLEGLLKGADTAGRLVDMNRLAVSHYFHPRMGGSTSLKYVLPAIWQTSPQIRSLPWLTRFVKEREGTLISPYEVLPPIEIGGALREVREGTSAMTAYQEMLFGESARDPALREKWRELLRQYCELDTLAMVVVFRHWLHG